MKRMLKVLFTICIMFLGLQMSGLTANAAIVSITEGSYTLRNLGTGKYLNVYGNKNANNVNIDVFAKDNTNGQDFKIYKYGTSYALSPLCSSNGRVVNVYAESAKSGNNVCLWSRTNHSTQLWKFDQVSGGYVIRCANNTSCVLNATGSKNNANVNITTYKSGNKNQIWVLESPATTTNAATSTLKITGVSSPSTITQGSAFSIKGTITSNYNVTYVTGQILKSDGTTQVYGKTVSPNAKSYSLYNSSVDTALLFNKLGAGTYYYRITAKDASGKRLVLVNSTFTVKAKASATTNNTTNNKNDNSSTDSASAVTNTAKDTTDTVNKAVDQAVQSTSKLKITDVAAPSSIYQGNAYSIKGKITSNYKINNVTGQILKSDGKTVVYSKSVNPNATSYSLYNSAIDKAMLFNKLAKGTYYYKVTAKDASGKTLDLVNKKFTVKQPNSKKLDTKFVSGHQPYKKVKGKRVDSVSCSAWANAYCLSIIHKKHYSGTDLFLRKNKSEYKYTIYYWDSYQYSTDKKTALKKDLRKCYDEINKGRPVIIWVGNNGKGTHYVAVYGYQNVTNPDNMSMKNLLILDPINFGDKKIARSGSKYKNIYSVLTYKK